MLTCYDSFSVFAFSFENKRRHFLIRLSRTNSLTRQSWQPHKSVTSIQKLWSNKERNINAGKINNFINNRNLLTETISKVSTAGFQTVNYSK